MMVAIGDLAQLNLFHTNSTRSDTDEQTFGFVAKTNTATFAGLASAFKTAMVKATAGGFEFVQPNTYSSTLIRVKDVKPGTAATAELAYAAVAGANAAEGLPPQCSVVFSWKTALAGRSFRGRSYLVGVLEASQADGNLTSTAQGQYQAILDNLLAIFGPSGTNADWQFCIISRVNHGAPRVPPIGTVVTSGVLRVEIQTQRRRNN